MRFDLSLSAFPKLMVPLALAASPAQAVVVAYFDFEPNTEVTSTDTETTSSAGAIITGGGLAANTSTVGDTVNQGDPVGTNSRRFANANATDEAGAVTGNDYFSITVTPSLNPSEALHFQSFSFGAERNVANSAERFFLRSSADSYVATLGSGTITTINTADVAFQLFSIDLTSLAPTNAPVTFRLYLYDGIATEDTRFDNITIAANVVPEPSSILLAVSAAGALAFRRYRQVR